MSEEVEMVQDNQTNHPPGNNPPDDSLRQTHQKILKFIWPSVVSRARKNLPPDIAREDLEDPLVVLWRGILEQYPEPEGRTPPPNRPKRDKTPEERREERKEREFEESKAHLEELIKARASEQSDPIEDEDTPEPGEKPSPEPEKPRPPGKVIPLRKKARKKRKRRRKVPRDILEDPKARGLKRSELEILGAMYRASWYGHSSKLLVWHEKRHRYGRFYFRGVAHLVNLSGWSEKTVKRALKTLKGKGLIYKRHHGWFDESNTIWELPYNRAHIKAWRRRPPQKVT